jgi:hypothetical protein
MDFRESECLADLGRISKYQDSQVYINSVFEDRYISVFVMDSEGAQTSVIMSQLEKSQFSMQAPLDASKSNSDPMAVYVSFLSLSAPNSYLRHYNGRIRLSRSEPTDIFKQDATFKLIINQQTTNCFTIESTNLPQWYISVDPETKAALMLTERQQERGEIFDETFLFRFMIQH